MQDRNAMEIIVRPINTFSRITFNMITLALLCFAGLEDLLEAGDSPEGRHGGV